MGEHARVLHVEDDENDFFFVQRAFRKAGLDAELYRVRDGQEAVDYLSGAAPFRDRRQFPLPDLVLLDIKMPRLGGFEVLAWLQTRSDLRDLPVVVLSSSNQERDIDQARALGACDYHIKPLDGDALVGLVRAWHERWLVNGNGK